MKTEELRKYANPSKKRTRKSPHNKNQRIDKEVVKVLLGMGYRVWFVADVMGCCPQYISYIKNKT